MKMHGKEFIKELVSRAKTNDKQVAIESFLQMFAEKATGAKEHKFKRSMVVDDSVIMYFSNMTRQECIQIDGFLNLRLQAHDYHAEFGVCVSAAEYPQGQVPERREAILWVVQTQPAINILLPAVGFEASAPKSIITSIKNSLATFLFPPVYESAKLNTESEPKISPLSQNNRMPGIN